MSKRRSRQQAAAELLQQGYRFHQQGRWELAAASYREALKQQPRNFDALHLLGRLALQTKDAQAAIDWTGKAIAVKPDDPGAHTTLGVALQAAGRHDDALASFDRVIRLQPGSAQNHYNRGKLLRELNRLEDALADYDAALKLQPDYPQAWNNRSEVLLALRRPEEAHASASRALQLRPDHAGALGNRGIALLALKQPDAALDSLDEALRLNPEMPNVLYNRANVLSALDRHAEALVDYERAIAMRPGSAEQMQGKAGALRNLGRHAEALACVDQVLSMQAVTAEALHQRGLILDELNRPAEALGCFERALSLKPDYADALINRGNALMRLHRFGEARAAYESAVRLAPGDAAAHWNLCLCLLLTGEFEQGWAEYDSRWSTILKNLRPAFNKPQWDGAPVAGTLLVWGEQGLGDQIIYASMLGEAAAHAGKLTVAIDRRLHPLFARSFPDFAITTPEQAVAEKAFDAQTPMGDLARYLRRDAADFLRHRRAFLKADAERSAELRRHLAAPPAKVCGLSWLSSNRAVGREKSLGLGDLLPELALPGRRFVDLQYGDTATERDALQRKTGIEVIRVPSIDTWNDIDGLAALINACDVIVTISNTTAHIAGALGKDVYLMLPYSQGRFWYWQIDRDDTLWYPHVRVFRQPAEGDWAGVVAQVRAALLAPAASTART